MADHVKPAGDLDLAQAGAGNDDRIVDGGEGPSGGGFAHTGVLGGMLGTADTVVPDAHERLDEDDPEAGAAAGVTTTLGDIVGLGTSDADGSALG